MVLLLGLRFGFKKLVELFKFAFVAYQNLNLFDIFAKTLNSNFKYELTTFNKHMKLISQQEFSKPFFPLL